MKSTSRFIFGLSVIIFASYLTQAQAIVEGTASSMPALDSRTTSAASGASSSSSRKSGNESDPAIADPLVRVLMSKGLLTSEEAKSISMSGTPVDQRDRLATLLRDKGLLSATEFEAVRNITASTAPASATTEPAREATNEGSNGGSPSQSPATPTKIAAVAPVRLLGIDSPKREGLIPDIKLGTGARLKLYGIFKTSTIHDSSSPQGN